MEAAIERRLHGPRLPMAAVLLPLAQESPESQRKGRRKTMRKIAKMRRSQQSSGNGFLSTKRYLLVACSL
jgi:hypothetical protein